MSIALMYHQGQEGTPRQPEAVSLLARLCEVTSVPLSEYREGMYWASDLVRGDIPPEHLRFVQFARQKLFPKLG